MSSTPLRTLAVAAALAIVPAASAAAASPGTSTTPATTTTTTTTTSTTTVPVVKPPAVKPAAHGSLHLRLTGAFTVGGAAMTVPGRGVWVNGVVRPLAQGQVVLVQAVLGGRTIMRRRVRIVSSRGRTYGHFAFRLAAAAPGALRVLVTHARSSQQLAFSARTGYAVLSEAVGFGSTGRFVELIQQRLQALHMWIVRSGVYDQGTGLAVDAYHRLLGWGTSQSLGPATIGALLSGRGLFHIRYPRQGHHAESNLAQQLLALADGANVRYIFPISSGKPSTPTILGSFRIYLRTPAYLPDGMYYSSFFTGGYAIHGYDPAPDYPASHGCMRLPIQDAIPAYDWLHLGNWVDSYY